MASDPVAEIDLVGVRFDGMGRSPGQAGAPQALRAAGLETALPAAELTSDVILPAPTSARGPAGFINEPALLAMVDTVYSRVGHSLRTGRFPLLYGADCAVLLAAIPALRDTTGRAALLFVDAHEDATTMEQSDNGEAANMEIALLLGLTGTHAPEPLRSRLPALDRDTIVMLGQRDHLYRRQIGVPTIAGQVPLHPLEELRGDPAGIATDAAEYLVRHAHGVVVAHRSRRARGQRVPGLRRGHRSRHSRRAHLDRARDRHDGRPACRRVPWMQYRRLQHRPRFRRTRGHAHRGLRRRRRRPCPARVSKPMPGVEGRPACPDDGWVMATRWSHHRASDTFGRISSLRFSPAKRRGRSVSSPEFGGLWHPPDDPATLP